MYSITVVIKLTICDQKYINKYCPLSSERFFQIFFFGPLSFITTASEYNATSSERFKLYLKTRYGIDLQLSESGWIRFAMRSLSFAFKVRRK